MFLVVSGRYEDVFSQLETRLDEDKVVSVSLLYEYSGLVSQLVSASDSHAGSPRFDRRGWQKKFAEQGY